MSPLWGEIQKIVKDNAEEFLNVHTFIILTSALQPKK